MWEVELENTRIEMQSTFERIALKKQKLQNGRPLSQSVLSKIREALSIEWTYNSNSIEGNSLTLRETQMVLQEGITVKGKPLKEHFEAHNHDKAIDHLYKLIGNKGKFSSSDVLSLHAYVLRSIEDEHAGRLRNGGVRISGANFVPPAAHKVSKLFDELIDFVNTNPLHLNDIEMAAILHHKFVWIHPFFDGNGRTVRLAMNLFLMQKGYPPAIILKEDRKKYYEALDLANKGSYQKLMLLICQATERSLNIYLAAMPGNDADYDSIQNIVAEEGLPYGQEYISLLARRGKIDAYKEGRVWYTSKKAVKNYMSTRKRVR
ncbi:MAG: Fic family protein [Sphingobacteriaceae bacterium]|nr:Fic family protein [Sphingobacteriaceae bacterium]